MKRSIGLCVALCLVVHADLAWAEQDPACATQSTRPFVPSRAGDEGPSLNWPKREASYKFNDRGTDDIAGEIEFDALKNSFAAWSTVPDGAFTFVFAGTTQSTKLGYDFLHPEQNDNIIIFQKVWSEDPLAVALTHATYNVQTGEIFDADIEFNNQNFVFTVGDTDVQTDLMNTAVHEVGHFIGFDHTDKFADDEVDASGIPRGSRLPRSCAESATMSAKTRVGETSKRVVQPTDRAGMVFVYPSAKKENGFVYPPKMVTGRAPVITQIGSKLNGCHATRDSNDGWPIIAALIGVLMRQTRTRALKRTPK